MGPAPQRALAFVAVWLAAGCMPYARGYLYLDGEGIAHEEEVCRTGPPVWAIVTARNVLTFDRRAYVGYLPLNC